MSFVCCFFFINFNYTFDCVYLINPIQRIWPVQITNNNMNLCLTGLADVFVFTERKKTFLACLLSYSFPFFCL